MEYFKLNRAHLSKCLYYLRSSSSHCTLHACIIFPDFVKYLNCVPWSSSSMCFVFFALASYLAARGIYQAYAAARVVEMIIYYLVCSLKAMAHDKRAKNQVIESLWTKLDFLFKKMEIWQLRSIYNIKVSSNLVFRNLKFHSFNWQICLKLCNKWFLLRWSPLFWQIR